MRIAGWLLLPLAAMALLLTACEPHQLYMASHTVVGINAAVNPEQTSGALVIGYDRTFVTVIPRSVHKTAADETETRDAMSALVCSNLAIEGITIRRYTESLATGPAAKMFADSLKGDGTEKVDQNTVTKVKDFFDCFKDANKQAPPVADKRP